MSRPANSALRRFVERIERIDATIKEHNSEKSGLYKDAKGEGYDVKIMRKVIAIRKNGRAKHQEEEALIDTYLQEIG